MPRKKKPASDMTNDELARSVFPKKVVDELKRIAHKGEKDQEKSESESSQE